MPVSGFVELTFDSLSLQLSASSKISLSTSCGELRTECKTRLGDGRLDLPGLLLGDITFGDEAGDEALVDGDVGEMDAGVDVRWQVTGEVIGDDRGLRMPSPMFEFVGKGAGASSGCSMLFCFSTRVILLVFSARSRRRSRGADGAPEGGKRPLALKLPASELFDAL